MKFTQSIRWRLLSWIAVLLGFSLLALDFAAYEIHLSNRVSLLDEALRRRVSVLSAAVFAPPGQGPTSQQPGGPPGGNPNFPPQQNNSAPSPPPLGEFSDNPLPDDFSPPPLRPGPPGGRPPFDAAQITAAARQFETPDANGFYLAVWMSGAATPSHQSTNCPAGISHPSSAERDTGTYTRTRGAFREAFHATEHGDCILVGRTLAPELADAQRFGGLLGLGSLGILALGLGGAWFIIAGALRPVEKISAVAAKISAGDLSQRINIAETESELGRLAAVLNVTFARLDAAFTRQKQFTADAAHELRTPVSVMLTHAQNGLAGGCASADHREAFEACQRAAQRMKKLIAALLALARLDDGQDPARRTKFDFSQTARECVELLRPLAAERNVKIFTELLPLEISGDAEQLAQVVTNLVANAIQYNRHGGEVRVKLEQQKNNVVLTVSDTGIGVAAADLPRVFERFYRADPSRSAGGLGLGLAITRAIVGTHGGTIEVFSEKNKATIFSVILPKSE